MINADNPTNVRHWINLCKTDPNHTKKFTRAGGFSGTDISPAYRIQRLTEEFGPCGEGWGHVIHSRWRETFPGKNGATECVFAEVSLWWKNEKGERCETGPQIGGTIADRTPDEAYKMAVTDAIGKCALFLGVAADVYLGWYDDAKYIRQLQEEFQGNGKKKKPEPPGKNGEATSSELNLATSYRERFASVWIQESLDALAAELKDKKERGEITQYVREDALKAHEVAKHRVKLADKKSWTHDESDSLLRDLATAKTFDDFDQWLSVRGPAMERDLYERFVRERNRVVDKHAQTAR